MTRWRDLTNHLYGFRFGHGEGAAEAQRLVDAKYQPTTQVRYLNAWEAFVAFCNRTALAALPAAPEAVVRYVGTYLASGSAAPDSVANYLTAIRAVHLTAGVPSPTDDPLVKAAMLGFRRLHVTDAGALPERRAPLPAAVLLAIVHLGLSTSDPSLQRECAGTTLVFLMCNRPGAAANLRARDLDLSPAGFRAQVPVYKMGILKQGERLTFRLPVGPGGWAADPTLRLVRRVYLQHYRLGRAPGEHLFAPPGRLAFVPMPTQVVTRWLRRQLALTGHTPPLGTKWTGHSLRAGAASAAYAVGLSVGLICQLMGLSSAKTAFKHYIDAQLDTDPAARELFSRYAPRRV